MKSFLIIFVIFFSFTTYADSLTLAKASPAEQPSIVYKSDSESAAHYYKLLYESSKKNNEELIDFMTSAFTTIVGLIAVMIGGAGLLVWAFNSRKYAKLKEENLVEIRNAIDYLKSKNSKDMKNELGKLSNQYNNLNDTVSELLKLNKSEIDTRLNSIGENLQLLKKDFDTTKSSVEVNIDELKLELVKVNERFIPECFNTIANYDLRHNDPLSAFHFYMVYGTMIINKLDHKYLNECLSQIDTLLLLFINEPISIDLKNEVDNFLNELPKEFLGKKQSLERSLATIRIAEK